MPARPDAPATRALAWLYCPAPQRPVLAGLLAIEREISSGLERGLDHQVAHARLAWWREECERCAQGQARHPLTRELQAHFSTHDPTALAALSGLAEAAAWDLATATFQTREELAAYCGLWSGALIEPLARFALPQLAPGRARALGCSIRELEMLTALVPDARAGRLRLPLDVLDRGGILPQQLAQPQACPPLLTLLREQHRRARGELARSIRALAADEQPPLRALLVWAALVHARSQRCDAALPDLSSPGDHHTPLDGWRAWRAARRAGAGRLALAD